MSRATRPQPRPPYDQPYDDADDANDANDAKRSRDEPLSPDDGPRRRGAGRRRRGAGAPGHLGTWLESLLPSLTLRQGLRADWSRREVWGQPPGTGCGVAVRRVWDTNIRYAGQHFGASYIEHQRFAHALRHGLPAEIALDEGLRSVAVGLAAHRSLDTGLPVALAEVLPEELC